MMVLWTCQYALTTASQDCACDTVPLSALSKWKNALPSACAVVVYDSIYYFTYCLIYYLICYFSVFLLFYLLFRLLFDLVFHTPGKGHQLLGGHHGSRLATQGLGLRSRCFTDRSSHKLRVFHSTKNQPPSLSSLQPRSKPRHRLIASTAVRTDADKLSMTYH
jgi:hypothetical protein